MNEEELRGKRVEPAHGKHLIPFKGCGFHLIEKSPVSKDKLCFTMYGNNSGKIIKA